MLDGKVNRKRQELHLNYFESYYLVFYPISDQCSHFYPLKTPENQSFSGAFRGYKVRTLTRL